ncbi:MAG TPA: hypothetical protein VHW09_32520 [Bryobacteraceae bacterium]|nr:hypothetical protein [Bryobacteraceae bacterium]
MRTILLFIIAAGAARPLSAQAGPFTFEIFADSASLTNQYAGAVFSNAIVLTSGITLNELEFPPHSGSNAASDDGGPIAIAFSAPLRAFAGYFTYGQALTVQAFDGANRLVASASSAFSNNEALSGASGSRPNEFLQVSSATSIYKIVITGSAQGASFTLDDAIVSGKCDLNLDGVANVSDAQAIINEALGATAAADDLNLDGAVNVVDVEIVMNAALGWTCAAT